MVDKVAPWSKWPEECGRRDGIRLVVCRGGGICILKDIFCFFEILRIRGLSMFRFDLHSLINQNKKIH